MAAPTLNGTTFYPSDIQRRTKRTGTLTVAANGARTWTQRGTKQEFVVSWRLVDNTIRAAIQTIANLTTTWTFVDENGASYTVQCEGEPIDAAVGLIDGAGDPLYDVTLTFFEA